jgi:hypothetical protein
MVVQVNNVCVNGKNLLKGIAVLYKALPEVNIAHDLPAKIAISEEKREKP